MLSFRLDTILLGIWITDEVVGNYNAAYNLIFNLLTFTATLNAALLPTLSRIFINEPDTTRQIYQRVMRYLFVFSLPIAVGTTLLAREIIVFLYTDKLSGAILPLQILIWVLPVLTFTSLCGSVTTVFHLERKTARINLINALVNIIGNLIVIPLFGILGASISTVFTEVVGMFQFGYVLRERFAWGKILETYIPVILTSFIMGVVVYLVRPYLHIYSVLIGAVVYILMGYFTKVWDWHEIRAISKSMLKSFA